MNLSVRNYFPQSHSLNPPQHKSSHHKENQLITTSKISHFLLPLQITKSHKFHLTPVCIYKFHTFPHPPYISHFAKDQRRVFPFLQPYKKILNPNRFFFPFINIRNQKMKSWSSPAFPTLAQNQESPTFQPHHSPTCPILPPNYPPTSPNLPSYYPPTFLTFPLSHQKIKHSKITLSLLSLPTFF